MDAEEFKSFIRGTIPDSWKNAHTLKGYPLYVSWTKRNGRNVEDVFQDFKEIYDKEFKDMQPRFNSVGSKKIIRVGR